MAQFQKGDNQNLKYWIVASYRTRTEQCSDWYILHTVPYFVVTFKTPYVCALLSDVPDNLPWLDDKTSTYMETNIASQDNSATPLLNFRASQMKAARSSDDGLQLDMEGNGSHFPVLQMFFKLKKQKKLH